MFTRGDVITVATVVFSFAGYLPLHASLQWLEFLLLLASRLLLASLLLRFSCFVILPAVAGFPAVLGVHDNLASILFAGVLAVVGVPPLSDVHPVVVDHAVSGIPAIGGSLLQFYIHIIE